MATRSINWAVSMLVISRLPPSSITEVMPRCDNICNVASKSRCWLASSGTVISVAPVARRVSRWARGAFSPQIIHVPTPAPSRSRAAVTGVRKVRSITTRTGSRPGARRTVRRGSSWSTVPIPTMMAAWLARSWWVRASDSAPLIQRDEPSRAAIRPSRVWAYARVTVGRIIAGAR